MDAGVSKECDYLCKSGMLCSSMRFSASSLDALRRFHGALFLISDGVAAVLFRCVRAHRTPDDAECPCCGIRCSVSVQNTLIELLHTVPCGVERCIFSP